MTSHQAEVASVVHRSNLALCILDHWSPMSISPTDAQLIEFEALPQDQPIVACNILKIKRGADGLVDPAAMASMMTYAQGMKRFVEAAGAEFIFAGMVDQLFVGPEGEDFQFLSMMRYPSRAAYLSLANDPEIQATIAQDREAGLESQWLLHLTEVHP